MKYITSVRNSSENRTEHIIDCGSGNVKILEVDKGANGMSEHSFITSDAIKIDRDLGVITGYTKFHLAQIVLAVEQVRFVMESKKGEV